MSINCGDNVEPHLFLGCSIANISCSLGWSNQSSEVTVTVVEDCGTHDKKYYDSNLDEQTLSGSGDPGFILDSGNLGIGAPAYLRFGTFEYCGLIQSWQKHEGQSGKAYTVKLVSPNELLEGTEVIIGEYAGSVGNSYNIINPFGYLESFSSVSCSEMEQDPVNPGTYIANTNSSVDGPVFGTPAGGYGQDGEGVNKNGLGWERIKSGINMLLNQTPIQGNIWSPYGRLMYRGSNITANYGLLPNDSSNLCEYFVDLSELPNTPSYFRFNGLSITLLEAINKVCTEAGYDYYIELVPIKSVSSVFSPSGIAKFVKVRTIDRGTSPSLGHINSFINSLGLGSINNTRGQELRNDYTSSIVIGGQKKTLYQIFQHTNPEGDADGTLSQGGSSITGVSEIDDVILPYFGLDGDDNFIVPEKDSKGFWQFDVNTDYLNATLEILSVPETTTISEKELVMALTGMDEWLSYLAMTKAAGDTADTASLWPDDIFGIKDLALTLKIISDRKKELHGRDVIGTRFSKHLKLDDDDEGKLEEDIHLIYDWVRTYATDYYGKKWAVRVPYTCVQINNESDNATFSEQPGEGGWTEFSTVLGLPTSTAFVDFFRDDDNLIGTIAAFTSDVPITGVSGIEVSTLDPNEYGIYDNNLYLKSNVQNEYVFHNSETYFGPRAIIELPQPINKKDEKPRTVKFLPQALKLIFGKDKDDAKEIFKEITKKTGGKLAFDDIAPSSLMPTGVAFGVHSNILTYGPWENPGPAGKVKIIKEEGLTPWNYGSVSDMNTAGQSLANQGITNMQISEMGDIKVPGCPTLPLGAEIGAIAGGFFGAGSYLIENRSANSGSFSGNHVSSGSMTIPYGFFNYSGSWSGTYGPNITSVSIDIGQSEISTTYQLRTYTPKIGRFNNANNRRLREISQLRIKNQKEIRELNLSRLQKLFLRSREEEKRNRIHKTVDDKAETPHEVLVGQITKWTPQSGVEYDRSIVALENLHDVRREIAMGYGDKAMMSLDGLIRPISMDGDGNLPRYIKPTGSQTDKSASRGYQTPVTGNYSLQIDVDYLNPFTNPSGMSRDKVTHRIDGSGTVGHDIDIVARTGEGSGNSPSSGIIMPLAKQSGYFSDYTNDYRMFSLRGPLLVHAWGYDLDGKPVPNAADIETEASGGNFKHENLQDKFMEDFLRKPHTWPVCPVDLRLDRERGVWSIPHPEIMEGTIKSGLAGGGFDIDLDITHNIYDADGNQINNPTVTGYSPVYGNVLPTGTKVLLSYNHRLNRHDIIESIVYKPIIQFKLTSGLTTSDITGVADIVGQFGFGADNLNTSVNVINTLTSDGSTYIFNGSSGNRGIAHYASSSNNYIIVNMECP